MHLYVEYLFVVLGSSEGLDVWKGVCLIHGSKTLPVIPWEQHLWKMSFLMLRIHNFQIFKLIYSHLAEYCHFLWIKMLLFQKSQPFQNQRRWETGAKKQLLQEFGNEKFHSLLTGTVLRCGAEADGARQPQSRGCRAHTNGAFKPTIVYGYSQEPPSLATKSKMYIKAASDFNGHADALDRGEYKRQSQIPVGGKTGIRKILKNLFISKVQQIFSFKFY